MSPPDVPRGYVHWQSLAFLLEPNNEAHGSECRYMRTGARRYVLSGAHAHCVGADPKILDTPLL